MLIGAGANADEVVPAISAWMKKRYSYQQWSSSPAFTDTDALQASGYTINQRQTFVIDLRKGAEALFNSFAPAVRRQIRKAEKGEVEIRDTSLPANSFRLLRKTFEKRGEKCPVPEKFFCEFLGGEALAPYRSQVAAYSGDELLSFVTLLSYKQTGYYALAATDPDHLASGVSSLLVWRALQQLQEAGEETFDFVGANIPSIARFKEGFGPTLREYYQVEHYAGAHVKFARALAKLIRG
jgi:lipid II:glycine glycyltransferase (peptidoglycan interpeptide bridge formation enzyme)